MGKRSRTWTAVLAAGFALAAAVAAHAQEVETLPVPRATVYPGDVISAEMLAERPLTRQEAQGAQAFLGREALVGKVARQTLLPGQLVPIQGVREPHVIKQGQPAVVVFEAGALVISATALPLEAGSTGEIISLRNSDSGTTIRGVVQADGTVRVGLP